MKKILYYPIAELIVGVLNVIQNIYGVYLYWSMSQIIPRLAENPNNTIEMENFIINLLPLHLTIFATAVPVGIFMAMHLFDNPNIPEKKKNGMFLFVTFIPVIGAMWYWWNYMVMKKK